VKQISNPLGSTKRGQRRKAWLTMAKSRLVVRTTALETGLGQLTSNSGRRRSRKQRDRMPLSNRQQQIPDRICEVDSENTTSQAAPTSSHPARSPGDKAKQSDITLSWSRQQQSSSGCVKSFAKTPKSNSQSALTVTLPRAFCKTKRHNGIVGSTTTEPVKSLARTPQSTSQATPTRVQQSLGQESRTSRKTKRYNAIVESITKICEVVRSRCRGYPARQSDTTPL
jgi:hypothetical protein